MSVSASVIGVNPTSPGATDGYMTISVTSHIPDNPGDIFYYSKDYGTTFVNNSTIKYKTFTGLGAGTYTGVVRVNGEFSNPGTVVLTDGSPPAPDPDTLVYKNAIHAEFCDKNGDTVKIDFQKHVTYGSDDPIVINVELVGENEDPVVISYKDQGDLKSYPINGSEATFKIVSDENFDLAQMYTEDERAWRVVISEAWNWVGYVIPDSCSEPFQAKPYPVTITATDALGTLKYLPFQNDDGTKIRGMKSDQEVLCLALSKTGLDLNIIIAVNTTETNMYFAPLTFERSPLTRTYINTMAFIKEDGTAESCYEVIRSIVERWSSRLHQWDGRWQMVNYEELSTGTIQAMEYRSNGDFIDLFYLGESITAGKQFIRDVQPAQGEININKALLLSESYYRFGYISNDLNNGDFNIWSTNPTGYPDGWVPMNGITGSTGIRMNNGTPTTDYYLIIDAGDDDGYFLNDTPVQIRANDLATISFDFFAPTAYNGLFGDRFVFVLVHDITNDRYFVSGKGWTSDYGALYAKYNANEFEANQFTFNYTLAAQDSDFQIQIGLYNLKAVGTNYTINVNNVAIQPGIAESAFKPPVGIFNKQTQYAKQTYTKDPILLLHGDEPLETQRTSGIQILGASDTFYRSLQWSRVTVPGEDESLLHIVANSELRAHQRPYRILTANFVNSYLVGLGINTLLQVDLIPDISFIFISGEFSLKTGNHTLRFAETLTDEVPSYKEEVISDLGETQRVETTRL